MKKILHIQVLPKLSGVQKISLEIFKYLPNDEYEKWILFSDNIDVGDKELCKKEFEKSGAKVIFSSFIRREICKHDIAATKFIYNLCKKEKFDIVHTHSTKPGIIGRIAATIAGVPQVIHTVHGLSFHKFVKLPKWQFYWACEMFASFFCHKIIMVNKFYGKYFRLFGDNKVSTIYNGIDFCSMPDIENTCSENCKILFVGRLDEQKDPMTILRVANNIVKFYPKIIFTLVGDGEYMEDCKRYISDNKLKQNIYLEGWQSNVSKYYASHDIFFAPSIFESFGLMFVEAGYYKLPIVATNVEGIPEVVKDGECGFLSNPRDELAMTNNIIRLIENKNLREQMGLQSYNRAVNMFSSTIMANKYKEEYDNLCK